MKYPIIKEELLRDVAVVIPVYNESGNIVNLVSALEKSLKTPFFILFVDGKSEDKTLAEIYRMHDLYGNVYCIEQDSKDGLGNAYRTAFEFLRSSCVKYVVTIDGDMSHDPVVIEKMLREAKNADLVIGSRFADGGKIIGGNPLRKCISLVASVVVGAFLKPGVRDVTSSYRCYGINTLNYILDNLKVCAKGYSYTIEYIHIASFGGFKIKEVPIVFNARKYGKSKMGFTEIFGGIITLIKLVNTDYHRYASLPSPTASVTDAVGDGKEGGSSKTIDI